VKHTQCNSCCCLAFIYCLQRTHAFWQNIIYGREWEISGEKAGGIEGRKWACETETDSE